MDGLVMDEAANRACRRKSPDALFPRAVAGLRGGRRSLSRVLSLAAFAFCGVSIVRRGMRLFAAFLGIALPAAALPAPAARGGTVTVFAAASLTDAFQAMQAPFEKTSGGWKLRFSFGASSALRTQIGQGAPADVFASADHQQMDPLAAAKLVSAPRVFARSRLVVALPAANPGRIRSVADLARPGLRLVTTAENVPIGRYTAQALAKLGGLRGYPAGFAGKVAANVVSREPNVRGVLAKVELAEADAGIVYETDARSSRRVKSLPIPAAANVLAEYPIAVAASSRNRAGAEAFVRFVRSSQGRAILKRFGFK